MGRKRSRYRRRKILRLLGLYVVLAVVLAAVAWARVERLISLDRWLGLSLLGFAVGLMPWQGIVAKVVTDKDRRERYVHDRHGTERRKRNVDGNF